MKEDIKIYGLVPVMFSEQEREHKQGCSDQAERRLNNTLMDNILMASRPRYPYKSKT